MKQKVGTIDIAPSWASIMPYLILAVEEGTETGKTIAKEELIRLAGLMDQYVKEEKERIGDAAV
jgi:hypothetical protein